MLNPAFRFDFGDGGPRLLDIRFADDISLFCIFAEEIRIRTINVKQIGVFTGRGFKSAGVNHKSTTT